MKMSNGLPLYIVAFHTKRIPIMQGPGVYSSGGVKIDIMWTPFNYSLWSELQMSSLATQSTKMSQEILQAFGLLF